MKTEHNLVQQDARKIDDSLGPVNLVVTSPPYPMIEMWDDIFSEMNSDISDSLSNGDGKQAFEIMHSELDKCWENIDEMTTQGSIVCINIGDATRKIGSRFQLFPNHHKIIEKFLEMGFSNLPNIIWRKPTNSQAKFMGSGVSPPNAYVTLEHEYILVFRKGGLRKFSNEEKEERHKSSIFYEERNKWFSDTWNNILGESQIGTHNQNRDRTAAYPLEIPWRLINMFSVHGDTVLDPFVGTGTTSVAAGMAGRNSIGIDMDESFIETSRERLKSIPALSKEKFKQRIQKHREFESEKDGLNYKATHFDFTVTTKQEAKIHPFIAMEVHTEPSICIEYERGSTVI